MYAHEELQLEIILFLITYVVEVSETVQFFMFYRLLLSFSITFVVEGKNISGSVSLVTYDMMPRGKEPRKFY